MRQMRDALRALSIVALGLVALFAATRRRSKGQHQSGGAVCGSPDQVAERIAQIHELCGITHYLAWTRIGGLAHQKVLRSMELMRDKVMPQVRPLGERVPAGRTG